MLTPTVPVRPLAARIAVALFASVAVATAAYCAHIYAGLGGAASDRAFDDVVYNAVMLAAPVALALRALTRGGDRPALLLIAAVVEDSGADDVEEVLLRSPSADRVAAAIQAPLGTAQPRVSGATG